jgi:hypothetical protein
MKQAQEGNFFFEEKFTTEPQPRNLYFPYLWCAGVLGQSLHISLPVLHQITRVLFGMALLVTSYVFIAYFVEGPIRRRVAFLLVCFSAGFGFFFASLYHFSGLKLPRLPMPWAATPCDQVHPQSITFWGIDWHTYAELSIAMMLLVFLWMLESYRRDRAILAVYAGFFTFLLALLHPYRVATVLFVLGLHSLLILLKDKQLRRVVIKNFFVLTLFSIFGMVFPVLQMEQNPVMRGWYPTQPMNTGAIGYLLGFGLLTIAACFVMAKIVKERMDEYYFLVIWAIGTAILFLSPLKIKMRIVEGLHITLCILTTIGLFWFCERKGWYAIGRLKRPGIVFIALFLLASLPSNIMHIIVDTRTARTIEYPYFLTRDIENVFQWMDEHLSKHEAVLASREMGSFIPARAGLKTYAGHWSETFDKRRKLNEVKQFMSSDTSDRFRIELLRKNKIDYLLMSDFERKLGSFDPTRAAYLKEIYRSGTVVLYQADLSKAAQAG